MRIIYKAKCQYVSKQDYETITKWGWEANFYTKNNLINENGRTQLYFYNNEVRVISESDKKIVGNSEYLFSEIFNKEKFDFDTHKFSTEKIKWIFNGSKYKINIFNWGYDADYDFADKLME